jgi:hypothetical protein
MVAENPNLVLSDNSYPVDYFSLVSAHELAHALGARHNNKLEGLLMSAPELKQGLLLDRDTLSSINSPLPDSGKK